ncbi:DUF1642 domain-containing protein [Aerococcaceae bacterium zg-B36]|uniref:DUF1642 domain-containing protein n=1 Tax=Aerococcaceae bacterium zg-252 TaxID=2796928 RepID=UPI001BD88820|nr:DUF1642 domain-containing protein [Aerococcaceae bacterium zg-B36]
MNKLEAIKRIENSDDMICKADVLTIINQIDEPQKVKIPQFVAEWFIKHDWRDDAPTQSIIDVLDNLTGDVEGGYYEEVWRWIQRYGDTFARAWLYGYEVERERLYRVSIPIQEDKVFCLQKTIADDKVTARITSLHSYALAESRYIHLTEAEIKKDFGWTWQFAVEVTE